MRDSSRDFSEQPVQLPAAYVEHICAFYGAVPGKKCLNEPARISPTSSIIIRKHLNMAQIKIYGLKQHLNPVKARLSDIIHSCVVDALTFPQDKRAHRFFPLEPDDFYMPAGRTPRYTIIEISMFEGRTIEAKKRLIHLLFERMEEELGLAPADLEITITETPKSNWGFRGQTGDEISLNYKIEV